MSTKKYHEYSALAVCIFSLVLASPAGWAQTGSTSQGSSQQKTGDASDAMKHVSDAAKTVKQMESDPQLQKLLQQAKGVFIVPKYGRVGVAGVGGRGGEGVMLVNNNGKWSNPVFYNFGGISVGPQLGVEVGSIAMLLMNDKAVNNFMQENKFSLTADAGLTIVNYTAKALTSAGRGDVVVWADTKGALADAAIGITDIRFDSDENQAFYKSKVAARDIVSGKVKNSQAASLTQELSSGR